MTPTTGPLCAHNPQPSKEPDVGTHKVSSVMTRIPWSTLMSTCGATYVVPSFALLNDDSSINALAPRCTVSRVRPAMLGNNKGEPRTGVGDVGADELGGLGADDGPERRLLFPRVSQLQSLSERLCTLHVKKKAHSGRTETTSTSLPTKASYTFSWT